MPSTSIYHTIVFSFSLFNEYEVIFQYFFNVNFSFFESLSLLTLASYLNLFFASLCPFLIELLIFE